MPSIPGTKSFWQKQLPTLLGLGVLVIALVVGTIYLGDGLGVFSPRATPETTPKLIRLTNVTDNSFTASFYTDEETVGFVKYGVDSTKLNLQAGDDRDQLAGTVGQYTLHHVTVRGLDPETKYFFTLGTGSNAVFNDNGAPFEITTAKRGGTPPAAKTVYGSVTGTSGSPAEGSIVYLTLNGAGDLSSLVKSSGSWAVPLSNARTTDGSAYAQIQDSDTLTVTVQGSPSNLKSEITTTVAQAQPVPSISLGGANVASSTTNSSSSSATVSPRPTSTPTVASGSAATPKPASGSATTGGNLSNLLSGSASGSATLVENELVDLTETTAQVVTTSQPTITGKAAPNVKVTIEVHSETAIEQNLIADANGEFVLDIAALSEELEPGEHTVTYSYTDPATGQLVTRTQTFTVQSPTGSQIAMASSSPSTQVAAAGSASPTPFGSGNPYSITSPTPTPSASASATPKTATSSSQTSTSSSRVSYPSTSSGVPVAGSVGTTTALVFGGLFFVMAGLWSFWLAHNWDEVLSE